MAKIKNPVTLSSAFKISTSTLDSLGVVDVMLDTDTQLFIDPLLLNDSQHAEMHDNASNAYKSRFEMIIKLLSKSNEKNDVPWRNAARLFKFSEISNTCLGYGASVKGSGFGTDLVSTTLDTAYQIVSLGIDDIDMFMVLALFEEGIGPDRISDMTTNIILDDLIAFTHRINSTLKLPTKDFKVAGATHNLIVNPCSGEGLILVPNDIVRDLPVAADWSDIGRVARENEELRERLNDQVGGIWARMTKAQKRTAKESALKSKEAFESVMELIKRAAPEPYDFDSDKNGEMFWTRLLESVASTYPHDLSRFANKKLTLDDVDALVEEILNQFLDLVENKGLWKELWCEENKPRKEKAAQRLLFAVAYSYCKANNLDLSPEADSGNGPVDFKLSQGFDSKVVVEIKLSTNPNVVHGYEKQLEIYKKADDTERGYFLLIDVGNLGKKYATVQRLRDEAIQDGRSASKIVYVDGNQKESASKRT
ncbi:MULTISPECIES: hypothetical protein [Vibrio]|uniref:Protein NO VEIN C-terminal domain-containing protein n=3 Tax=Vibrionaceae TaxID=641 RepID=A0AAW4HH85_VIBVL|nr:MULTISPECIES: hypothetical protein [Vibrio]EJG0767693.1 hypothetical protein [Vibrio parahaemolyticus O5:K30]EJA3095844.1 hypothetical protein [Vibrio parahaemolyticus]ELA9213979.1 hypothetical protein [Vibrio parahaemolyticus]MBD6984271.1 hypothetical protein [Vibrio parahaemolyticus]MBD6989299.1 hypothetical protein [Vibrio parahaemolyticus]